MSPVLKGIPRTFVKRSSNQPPTFATPGTMPKSTTAMSRAESTSISIVPLAVGFLARL